MYDIKQFRPTLYTLLMLGMTGFALAMGSPGAFIVSIGATLLNAWLVHTRRFRPLPRLISNGIVLLGVGYVFTQVRGGLSPILVIGQFLILLQLVKLYEIRANRDYAQLIVLSLLLIVAATISTSSLIFFMLLTTYLFLSLYCCLLFHLKCESDYAKQQLGVTDENANPATLRQDQRYLSSSMRRLTAAIATVSIFMAAFVFVFFPRSVGAGLLGLNNFRLGDTLTGFDDKVSFQNVAKITQNQQEVAYLKIFRNDKPVEGTMTLMLRGNVLDTYSGNAPDSSAWQWSRSRSEDASTLDLGGDRWQALGRPPAGDLIRQEFQLDPTGTSALFALPGVSSLRIGRDGFRVRYSGRDDVIQAADAFRDRLKYDVVSLDSLDHLGELAVVPATPDELVAGRLRNNSRIDPKIAEYARRAEVSGADGNGSLADRRPRDVRLHKLDEPIAAAIAKHLRGTFGYTLDLTDTNRIAGQDPMVAFLYDLKRGHCEYFAGAMTLMCQSLGMEARMVVGFRATGEDYNRYGGYYLIRQSNAHAWVEVRTERGWVTFDPTSSHEATDARSDSLASRIKKLFDYLEFSWANTIVAYDSEARGAVIRNLDAAVVNTAGKSSAKASSVNSAINSFFGSASNFFWASSGVLQVLVYLAIFALVCAVGWFALERIRLRARARRIGLDAMTPREQMRLARQLGFYDELLRLLEKYGIARPAPLTPMEFSASLAFLPPQIFGLIGRATNIFYRVRYGQQVLTPDEQRRMDGVIEKVAISLADAPPRRGRL